jgi:hypothetical protein
MASQTEEEQFRVSQATTPEAADGTFDTGAEMTAILETAQPPPIEGEETKNPPLCVRITAVNRRSHLDGVVRVCHRSMSGQQQTQNQLLMPAIALSRYARKVGSVAQRMIQGNHLSRVSLAEAARSDRDVALA